MMIQMIVKSRYLSINNFVLLKRCVSCCQVQYSTKQQEPKYPRRIFSGIQPTGTVHLGNYLGAIKQWVDLQEQPNSVGNVMFSIVDMHAITLPQDPDKLRLKILQMTATLIACGVSPEKSIIFQQSSVPMHAELAWVLGCMTTLSKLSLLPQFKEKSENLKIVPLGLLTYPILQAADILLYKATHVPVGEDQLQHLHLTQHIVNYFNGKYGHTFPFPQPLINDSSGRIKSLKEPTKKMSKSSIHKKSCITLIDPPEIIKQYIQKATTDFTSEVTFDPENRPGVSNLVNIHALLTHKDPSVICSEAEGLNTGQYKLIVADVIIEKLAPIRSRYFELMDNTDYIVNVLTNGAQVATSLADKCWKEVKEKIGFAGGPLALNSSYNCNKQKQCRE